MISLPRLGLVFTLLSSVLAAQTAGLVRNAPVPLAESPLAPRVDLDDSAAPRAYTLAEHFTFPAAAADASFGKITTQFGDIYLEFLSADAPLSVANFKSYLATASTAPADLIKTYDGVFIHRSIPGFILQTGGYKLRAATPPATGLIQETITKRAPILNEFKVANTRGTLAFAKFADNPNSATNEWFINLADNRANLDNQNGGFTAFARILGDGMTIADRIATFRTYRIEGDGVTFDTLPLTSAPAGNLALSQFVILPTLRAVSADAVPASAKTLPLSYSLLSNSRPRSATATVSGGVLTVGPGAIPGRSVVTVRTQAIGGHFLDTEVEVVRAGPPTLHAQLPGTTTAPLGTAATLVAETNVWPVGTIRWERKAPGSGSTFTPIAAADPLFSGESTERLVLALDSPTTPAATLAALQGNEFRFVLTNPFGTVTSRVTKLKITTQKVGLSVQPSALVSQDLGGTATFSVTALPVAANTPLTYRWQRLPSGQKTWLDLVNSTASASTPFTGADTRTLSVKLDDLALDGSQFRCVLRNALADAPPPVAATGTVTSKSSTLRILAARRTLVTAESAPLPGLTPATGVTFAARGLPKGLALDPATGVLSGTAAVKPGIYRVTVTTRGPSGTFTQIYNLEIIGLSGANTGGYEAFLAAEDQPPFAKLALNLTATGTFTGTLTTSQDTKPLALRGSVLRSPSGVLSLATPLVINRSGSPSGRAYRLVDFRITSAGLFTVALESRATLTATFTPLAAARSLLDEDDEQIGNPGVRLGSYTRSSPAPWANLTAYTLALTAPAPLDHETETRLRPAGSGYATAAMSPEGRLTLRGKLADGAPFTAVLDSDLASTYRLFARPYGAVPGAYLIAELPLRGVITDNPQNGPDDSSADDFNRFSVRHDLTNANPALRFDDGTYAFWQKPADLKSPANYRPGFGPLGLTARLEPWLFFDVTELGLVVANDNRSGRIALALSGEALSNTAPNTRALPTEINVRFSDASFVDATLPDASGLSGRLNSATGFFSGKFTLTDPGARNRVIPYEGVFIVPRSAVSGTVTAEGFTLVPALSNIPASLPAAGRVQLKKP